MTKLSSGQGKRDDADADQSNTYMSPFQATQKHVYKKIIATDHDSLTQYTILPEIQTNPSEIT